MLPVIEAIFEEMEVKVRALGEVEEVLAPDAVLATNTSSLSVTRMGNHLRHPERFVGLHFFNPVSVMPLIEVIKGEATDDLTLATAFDLTGKLKKTGILVKDSPAFLVNRVLIRMLSDCMRMVDEGAGFRQVDGALLALGLPMGPFALLGLVGPAVAFHAAQTLNQAFGAERFPVSRNFGKLVAARIPGFYQPSGEYREVRPEVEALWERSGRGDFTLEEIQRKILGSLALEIDSILREGVVKSSKDVDLAMILGAGWPFFMGGITMTLDLTGISREVLGKAFFHS